MESKIYNQEGKEVGKIKLPESVFGQTFNADLVHQVVTGMAGNRRTPVAHTKDRSEVSGVNKKPWRQKGTGRARHGSRRSPIWRTGGVAHGPRNEKDYSRKINKKMRVKALYIVLSQKLKDGEIIFVNNLNFADPKASQAKDVLSSLSKIKEYKYLLNKKNNSAIVATDGKDINVEKSFNNFGNIKVNEVRNLNPLDILNYKYLLIEKPEEAVKFIESRLSVSEKPLGRRQVTGQAKTEKKVEKKVESKKTAKVVKK